MLNQLNFINVHNVNIIHVENLYWQSIWERNMESLKNVNTAINYLEAIIIWIITWKKSMEAQNTIVHIAIMCLAFNQCLMCMSRMFIQGEVRYRNLSFNTWYIFSAILMKIYLFTSTDVLQCISYYYIPLAFFSSSANSQYFFMKISWIGPWVSRIDWCEAHWYGSTYKAVRLSDIRSKTAKKCFFCVFRLFLSLCRPTSRLYRLSHTNTFCTNHSY